MAGEVFKLVGKIAMDGVKGVEKGLDNVQSGLEKTEQKLQNGGKKITAFGDGVSKVGGTMTKWVTGPIVAVGAGMIALATAAGNYADRILDLNAITGMSTDAIQEWQHVARVAGVSNEALTKAAEGLIKRLPALEEEGGKATEALTGLGLSYDDIKDKSPDEQFDLIIGKLADMEDPVQANVLGSQLFGGAWKDLAPILSMGGDEIDRVRAQAQELGLVLDEDALNGANDFRIMMDTLKGVLAAVGLQIGAKLAPLLTDVLMPIIMDRIIPAVMSFVDNVTNLIDWFRNLSSESQQLIGRVIGIAAAIGPVLVVVGGLISKFGWIITTIGKVGLATSGLVLGIGLLVAALIYAYNTSETFRNIVNRVFEAIVNFVKPILADFLAFIKNIFGQILTFWNQNGAMIMAAFKNVFNFLLAVAKAVLPVVMAFVNGFINGVKNIIQGGVNVILGIIKFFSAMFTGNWSQMFAAVRQILSGAMQLIWGLIQTGLLGKAFGIIKKFGSSVTGFFPGIFSKVTAVFSRFTGGAPGIFSKGFNAVLNIIKNVFGNMLSLITGRLSAITGRFSSTIGTLRSIWSAVTGIITGPVNKAVTAVGQAVAKISGFFSNLKISIPKFKVPRFSVQGSLNPASWFKGGLPKLSVDWYAKGGVFSGPSIIGVGEQPGVSEAVLPLREDIFAKIGRGIQAAGGGSFGKGVTQVLVKVFVDGEEISSVIEPIVSEIQGRKGNRMDIMKGGV